LSSTLFGGICIVAIVTSFNSLSSCAFGLILLASRQLILPAVVFLSLAQNVADDEHQGAVAASTVKMPSKALIITAPHYAIPPVIYLSNSLIRAGNQSPSS
jgi:hypothetical protein